MIQLLTNKIVCQNNSFQLNCSLFRIILFESGNHFNHDTNVTILENKLKVRLKN